MKRHLTEKELIEYQFKLGSDAGMKEAAGHLESCDQCRGNLEKIQRKYSALDLLGKKAEISEDLISRVTEQARRPVVKKIAWFKRPVWMSSAAALIVVGLVLVANQFNEHRAMQREAAQQPALLADKMESRSSRSIAPMMEMEATSKPDITQVSGVQKNGKAQKATLAMASKEQTADMYAAKGKASDEAISEQPPFAPASAIELVTLPRRDKVQLTIYNSADMTLVRERRNLTMKKGWNWLQFMWANTLIDPTSLSLEPLEQADKIDIQQLVFPARLRELGRWLIHSEVSGQVPFEITYFTSGIAWRAFYMGTLAEDEKTMQLQGYVRVNNNSGEDYEEAETRLIVGNVHILDEIAELAKRQYPYNRPIGSGEMGGMGGGMMGGMLKRQELDEDRYLYKSFKDGFDVALGERFSLKEIRKEGLSEYFLYSIEGTETIPNQWGKRLLSFDVKDIEVESLYKYDEQRWGNQTIKFVKFANDEEHNLGETPIPNGDVKIYGKADSDGSLSYVGGTNIKYIPVDEEVELNLGPARLVKVEPKLMDFKTDNYVFDRRGNVAGWDEIRTWTIEINNTRELPVEIEITRGFGMAYWTIQSDAAYEKYDATHARFKVNLQPGSKQTLEYTVKTYHGTRQNTLTGNN